MYGVGGEGGYYELVKMCVFSNYALLLVEFHCFGYPLWSMNLTCYTFPCYVSPQRSALKSCSEDPQNQCLNIWTFQAKCLTQ